MANNPDLEYAARSVSGHFAMRIFFHYGETRGVGVMRGMVAGMLLAAASVLGWEETQCLVDELDTRAHIPRPGEKPKLVVVNG